MLAISVAISDYFFYSKFLLIYLLQFFFIKCSNDFFTITIINNISPWDCILNFFNHKNSFRPIWSIALSKNFFVFRYSQMITNFKFRIFIIKFFTKVKYVLSLTLIGFILIVLYFLLLYLCTISSSLSIYTFLILKSCICRSCSLLS